MWIDTDEHHSSVGDGGVDDLRQEATGEARRTDGSCGGTRARRHTRVCGERERCASVPWEQGVLSDLPNKDCSRGTST